MLSVSALIAMLLACIAFIYRFYDCDVKHEFSASTYPDYYAGPVRLFGSGWKIEIFRGQHIIIIKEKHLQEEAPLYHLCL